MCNIEGLKFLENTYLINDRKYRRANQEWTIQRHWATQDTGRRQTKQKTQHRKLKI
jgi:hypothetical protein